MQATARMASVVSSRLAFADGAIAAEADFIVTSGHHFDTMIGSGYKPEPISPEQFITRHLIAT